MLRSLNQQDLRAFMRRFKDMQSTLILLSIHTESKQNTTDR